MALFGGCFDKFPIVRVERLQTAVADEVRETEDIQEAKELGRLRLVHGTHCPVMANARRQRRAGTMLAKHDAASRASAARRG